MLDLGYLTVSNSNSFITARTKIYNVLLKIGFSEIASARMSAALSEIMRRFLGNGNLKINISIQKVNNRLSIQFEVNVKVEKSDFNYLSQSFDDVSVLSGNVGACLKLSKFLDRNINLKKDYIFLDELRRNISLPSREELMEQLSLSNNELMKSEQFLKSILGSIRSVVYVLDSESKYQFVNHAFEELSGLGIKNIIGHSTQEIFPETGKHYYENNMKAVTCKDVITKEEYYTDSKGKTRTFLTTRVPMITDKKVTGICGILTDITYRKQMERELMEAEHAAKAASRSKSEFLANMSHEVRTPLNAIIGLSYLLQKSELSLKQMDYVKKVQLSSQHLLGLINDVLDFSKIEAGKFKLENIEFQLSDVLDNLSNLMGEKCISKGLELIFDIDTNLPTTLYGDPLRLGQILINYTGNAIKFTKKGEIIVRIKEQSQIDGTYLLRFEVQDTGIGITEEQKGNLFQSFQQADASITRKYGGTGLGLAISKHLANLMGGDVGVESVYGEGSTFWFTALLKAGKEKIKCVPCTAMKNIRVLVVEDNLQARTVLCDMFKNSSIRADDAKTGYEAIEKIKEADAKHDQYKIIYMDMQMPGINGAETYRRIKALSLPNQPKCIMITAFGREEVFHEAEAAGIESVLVKPVNPSIIHDTTIQILCGNENYQEHVQQNFASSLISISGAKILLAEDNKLNQQIVTELLKEGTFHIDIAESGEGVLQKIRENTYDIVLMDIQMPGMDGIEAAKQIRTNGNYANLPIIAMTANAMESDIKKCFEAGMNDYIAKPIEPQSMFKTLLRWVNHKHMICPKGNDVTKENSSNKDNIFIPGLNTKLGIRHMLGNQKLYVDILRKFAYGQKDSISKIREAVNNNDYDLAERIAHTLKSIAGSIGAEDIQKSALLIEKSIRVRAPDSETISQSEKANTLIKEMIENLKNIISVESKTFKRKTMSNENLIKMLIDLKPCVKKSRPKDCQKILEQYANVKWPDKFQAEATLMILDIKKYRYKEALDLLELLLSKLKEGV